MIVVSDEYKSAAEESIRDIDTKIVIGSVEYDDSNNTVIEVSRSISDNGFTIGSCISDMMTVEIAHLHANQIPSLSNYNIIPYVYIGDAENRLGNFFITDAKAEGKILKLEAHDKMYFLDKPCKFNGNSSGTVSALTFPATHAQILDYIAAMCNFTHKCICYEFAPVVQRPLYNSEGVFDSEKYYTYREIIGFIASANASNAHFDNNGELEFIYPGNPVETILEEKCESLSACEADEGFKVKGVRFISKAISYFINDTEGAEYSDDMAGIIECDNPLATVEIAEYVWSKLGNFTYYSAAISRRGKGILYPGDVVEFLHNGFNYNSYITEISYRISADDGFKENIISSADSPAQSENRSISSEHTEENAKNITNNVNVDKAIILRDNASQMVIHNYTEIGYLSGNTIGYGDTTNEVIVNGYIFRSGSTLYLGTTVDNEYASVEFPIVRSQSKTISWSDYKVEAKLMRVDENGNKTYQKVISYVDENGTRQMLYKDSLVTKEGYGALVPMWQYIFGTNDDFPCGYVQSEQINFVILQDGVVVDSESFPYYDKLYISFSSEAEYNAAVGLTNTPLELTKIQDFQRLVPESQIIVDKELSPDSDNVIANSAVAKALAEKADKADVQSISLAVKEKAESSDLTAHTDDKSNPHKVTKEQIGLSNVENKSSADILSELSIGGTQILRNTQTAVLAKITAPALWSEGTWRKASGSNGTWESIDVTDCPEPYIEKGWRITSNSATITISQNNIPLVVGKEYTLSCYARGNGRLLLNTVATVGGGSTTSRFDIDSEKWEKFSHIFTAQVSAEQSVYIGVQYQGDSIDVCGMKLEIGNRATSWNICPKDIADHEDRIKALEAAILSLGGET